VDREALYYWVALNRIPGLGKIGRIRLLQAFGSPEAVFQADPDRLEEVEGIRRNTASAIAGHKKDEGIERELDALEKAGIGILTFLDPAYPPLLKTIHDPPIFLYYKGRPSAKDAECLALVGSRSGSSYGIRTTERLARGLAQAGLTVVSGMAVGIDAAAHNGALMAYGRTVAVLGSGLDVIYPRENERLFHRIAESGMVVSEFPLGTLPERQNFPIRNRIISGMSLGVVIVEAASRSGSLITARLALDQGREVFAVPGNVESLKSSGTNSLIKQGAKLVEHVQDILEEIRWSGKGISEGPAPEPAGQVGPPIHLPEEEARIYALLEGRTLQVDEIVRLSGLGISSVLVLLLNLELKGLVKQLPGKFFTLP
jgi:DNA processing protein